MIIQLDIYQIMIISKFIQRLIAIELSWQKELDTDPKAFQQIGFTGQLKNPDDPFVSNESVFL